MRQIIKFFWVVGLFMQANLLHAAGTQIEGLIFSGQQSGRLQFDLSKSPHYRYFTLKNPSRLVVDFQNAALSQTLAQPPADHAIAVAVRSAVRNKTDVRVVVELNAETSVKVAALERGKRLRFDLSPISTATKANKAKAVSTKAAAKAETTAKKSRSQAVKASGRDIVIAIDAGHGGKDIGAQGSHGTQEKDVVLAIAKRLENVVNRQPGMKALMIRDGDYFVKLRKRVDIAQKAKADLFVSIHADAFEDPSAHGASVYTLSTKGASSQIAQYLANSENSSDIAGGYGSEIHDDTLASVLTDLSNKAAKEASQHVGNRVLKSVNSVSHLHRHNVQKAGFVVLKSPIPSILVETAFISNPKEESRLNSRAYQEKMAAAIYNGILAHFKRYAPADTLFAQLQKSGKSAVRVASRQKSKSARDDLKVASAGSAKIKHVISPGETLSGIAQQYGVSMRDLRNANGMVDVNVKAGQVLQIPRSS
ncbi:N-acetylmuramoyl-L-alanine amidase [Methylomonas sp. MgM2]